MTVYLVGAGPGDPELLTVRAARLLAAADVVLYDRLVAKETLALAPDSADMIDVGKSPGNSSVQSRMNEQLVEAAVAYPNGTIVRLKGGDPYLFGRGGEEVEALQAAGIDYQVVPGVTSALAAPSAAGIPVTHRDIARSVTIITGHDATDNEPVDWTPFAAMGPHHTLVVMMGARKRGLVAASLIAAGASPDTPVAFIEQATTAVQRILTGTLGNVEALDVRPPAVFVIGAVATLARS
jgi:uroporphyrin-III C-methyltransferase